MADAPRGEYLRFAERCKAAAEDTTDCGAEDCDGPCRQERAIAERWRTAERHARLLAEIETWANEKKDWSRFSTPREFGLGEDTAKAHIRALLEQP